MPKILTSSKAILHHDNKFLIVKEDLPNGSVWDLPGGKIKYGESPEETLIREIKEELDLNIEILKPVGSWFFFTQQEKNQIICQTFLCNVKGKLKINTSKNPANEEFSELKWLTYEEALKDKKVKIPNSLRKILIDLNKNNGKKTKLTINASVAD